MIGWYPPLNDSSGLTWHMVMHVLVIIKKETQKISRSSFACWELSHLNSFVSFLSFGGREEKTMMKMLSGSHMHYC